MAYPDQIQVPFLSFSVGSVHDNIGNIDMSGVFSVVRFPVCLFFT